MVYCTWLESGADPGFLDRRFKFTKGFDLLIVHNYLLFFHDFSDILHENGIVLSQKTNPSNPLWIHHWVLPIYILFLSLNIFFILLVTFS